MPLMIGERERYWLGKLRERAAAEPVNVIGLEERLLDDAEKRAHMDRMGRQTVALPMGFLATFAIETGHPIGTVRHLSLSHTGEDRVPVPEAAWMVAEHLGFVGSLRDCHVWIEDLIRGDQWAKTINLVQPLSLVAPDRGRAN